MKSCGVLQLNIAIREISLNQELQSGGVTESVATSATLQEFSIQRQKQHLFKSILYYMKVFHFLFAVHALGFLFRGTNKTDTTKGKEAP